MLKKSGKYPIIDILDAYRSFLMFFLIFVFMAIFAPNFLHPFNLTNVLRGTAVNAMLAVGLSAVMITKNLDLSIGSNLTLGAMFTIGFQPSFGWGGSFIIAILAGGLVGAINGLLVTKGKIDSFIVTLGMMITVQGAVFIYGGGSSLSVRDFLFGDWLRNLVFPMVSIRVVITIFVMLAAHIFLTKTNYGRGFYMVGANKETAWLAGLSVDMYITSAFIFSGMTAALGGALLAATLSAATPTLGVGSLMVVMAATIIGGVSMAGGKGTVIRSVVAVLALTTLHNGFMNLGAGFETKVFASGLVLAGVVLYESYALYKADQLKGQKPELLIGLSKRQKKAAR